MGLFDEYQKKVKPSGFRPIDLNETNVDVIFKRCLADENTTEKCVGLLFPQLLGWSKEDDQSVYFDEAKIKKDEKSILFLYGQVASWDQARSLTPKSVSKKYTKIASAS
ncbi:MAG: hypothetical protein LUF81_08510 [Clostridiales bacterium]|nr:hypothetical protein [Clostridiales bacterium]